MQTTVVMIEDQPEGAPNLDNAELTQANLVQARLAQALDLALAALQRGELVAFPTDTVYGVGAILDEAAIEKLYEAKVRDSAKAIPVLLGELNQLARLTPGLGPLAARLAQRFWPGPLTLVVPRRLDLPANLSAQPTLGVRMPDHPLARELLRRAGPLAVTSANLSGAASSVTAGEVLAQLGGRIALILDGGRTPGGSASTVVDCTAEPPRILRPGPISEQMIAMAIS